jgi:hypothetical protein
MTKQDLPPKYSAANFIDSARFMTGLARDKCKRHPDLHDVAAIDRCCQEIEILAALVSSSQDALRTISQYGTACFNLGLLFSEGGWAAGVRKRQGTLPGRTSKKQKYDVAFNAALAARPGWEERAGKSTRGEALKIKAEMDKSDVRLGERAIRERLRKLLE